MRSLDKQNMLNWCRTFPQWFRIEAKYIKTQIYKIITTLHFISYNIIEISSNVEEIPSKHLLRTLIEQLFGSSNCAFNCFLVHYSWWKLHKTLRSFPSLLTIISSTNKIIFWVTSRMTSCNTSAFLYYKLIFWLFVSQYNSLLQINIRIKRNNCLNLNNFFVIILILLWYDTDRLFRKYWHVIAKIMHSLKRKNRFYLDRSSMVNNQSFLYRVWFAIE